MARLARVVVPGLPHHVTQRGGRRQQTFFSDDDYADYLTLLLQALEQSGVTIWAYCLMPNHVHFIAVPTDAKSLARVFRTAHMRHARRVNEREGWRGHLWQERFYSVVMDERHLLLAARYIEHNPVRAGLCRRPEDWRWSSVHAHLGQRHDPVVDPLPLRQRVQDWTRFIAEDASSSDRDVLRRHTYTGRPVGSDDFLTELEQASGRPLRPRPAGRKRRRIVEADDTRIARFSPDAN
jgi:putative transposase